MRALPQQNAGTGEIACIIKYAGKQWTAVQGSVERSLVRGPSYPGDPIYRGRIMTESDGGIIVGVLGQWASGKTEAARTLIRHLGGEGDVVFLTDRVLFARQAVNHILELEESDVTVSLEEDGRRRLEGELATVWLGPGEDLRTVEPSTLDFRVRDDQVLYVWRNRAKIELGRRIREQSAREEPVVTEAAFGPNVEPEEENLYGRTISDFFTRLERSGVEPKLVKWIVVEACFERRSLRNDSRRDSIPAFYFDRFGADGGDLTPDHQNRLEEQGTMIRRVPNDHDDIERFRAEVIAALEDMR